MVEIASDVTARPNTGEQSDALPLESDLEADFERVAADGERFVPHRFRDGFYRVADPALGRTKHHAHNQIAIRRGQIETYLSRGFLLRMRGEISGQVNLISPEEISIRK